MDARFFALVGAIGVGATACAGAPEEPAGKAGVEQSAVEAAEVAGYEHTLERSRFDVGGSRTAVADAEAERVVGDYGAFALFANGAALARPHGGAQPAAQQPYGASGAEHDEHVREYFVGAGLPADQIEGVYTNVLGYMVKNVASPEAPPAEPWPKSWVSVLRRQVRGIRVVDSVAWARFDVTGRLLAETVYWPALPEDAVAEAEQLVRMLGDASSRATFLEGLPDGTREGKVVLRHTSYAWRGAFRARASYDVEISDRGMSQTRHFGVDGAELRMPEEETMP